MLNIYQNKPLLFVDAPPIFIKVAIIVEESTSVFILENEEQSVLENEEQVSVTEALPTNPGIQRKIIYLSNSFRRQAYQPLQFVLEEETLSGTIEKIEEETVWIDLEGAEHKLIAVEIGKIEEVLWRGKPFDETK
ncbi:hypothetical protein [Sporosarcina sp. E16_8]|uniref:hypothetical protein n=1 Tax=Sporosarcina sp. E16_8 TaxID=2789295 RepID=UPI001A921250|nr:hypothetical protein [Sporosarcina sp. E16_8]MBO0585990.1 hypothetical protein [Sporosarcina sp. E16_8]